MSEDKHTNSTRVSHLLNIDRTLLPPDGGKDFNRLIFTSSPYLLQHAENPVDWYPWGEEAFRAARSTDRPILLSIGYATCHWCHVMEHESFEDAAVAAAINRTCIAIKVDREERPDIDDHFMLAAQLLSGGGGWPLNLLITADKEAFFAATYLPKHSRGGQIGVIELMDRLKELWQGERGKILENGATLRLALQEHCTPQSGEIPGDKILSEATAQLVRLYDHRHGGFGRSPKFPMPVYLSFLLRRHSRSHDQSLRQMIESTLQAIWRGGIYDQLGGGLHRYSVDEAWLVPHFEKMLYDQACVAMTVLETYQSSGDARYLDFAGEIFSYVLRDMVSEEGGFYAAEDADSSGHEGAFYLWTLQEMQSVLGSTEGEAAARYWGATSNGNFEGRNILHRQQGGDEWPAAAGWREELLNVRSRRERPLRDEKILCSWNGLMIAALAKGYSISRNPGWLAAAQAALDVISTRLTREDGRLLRSYHAGVANVPAFADDYAFAIWGLIELHQGTLEQDYLDTALHLSRELLRLFAAPAGGLFQVGSDAEQLPVQMQSSGDGVTPSALAVAALNLLRLGLIADAPELTTAGAELLRSQTGEITTQPLGHLFALCALDFLHGPPLEITLNGGTPGERQEVLHAAARYFLPHLVLRSGETDGPLQIMVCAEGSCRPPLTNCQGLEALLKNLTETER